MNTTQQILRFREYKHWNIVLGCKASRISVFDARGDEHYALVAMDGRGKANRERKYAVLEAIASHINKGGEPGEVDVEEALR